MPKLTLKRARGGSAMSPRRKRQRVSSVARSVNRIPRSVKSFPRSMRVKIKYNAIFDGSIVAATQPTQFLWRANSPFDPDAATGGGQPRGFVQWSAFYEKYHVVKSSCRLRLMDKDTGTSTTGTVTGLYGISVRDSNSVVSTVRELTEDDAGRYSGYDSYHAKDSVMLRFDAAKHWGCNNLLDNDHLGGTTGTTFGSNPLDQAYFITWATQAPSSGAAAQPFLWDVMLEYDVIFTDPRDLTA